MGGHTHVLQYDSAEVFHIDNGKWEDLPSMRMPRSYMGAVTLTDGNVSILLSCSHIFQMSFNIKLKIKDIYIRW